MTFGGGERHASPNETAAPEKNRHVMTSMYLCAGGCCYSRHTKNCCFVCCVLGALLLLLGVVVLAAGRGLLMSVVLSTMPLKDGTDRFNSWLNPPVQPHLTG